MKTYLFLSFSLLVLIGIGCKKDNPPKDNPLPTETCSQHFKGKTLEVYQADTQRFDKNGQALFSKGTILIDSLNYSYTTQTFNKNADSVSFKYYNGFAPQTVHFKIVQNKLYLDTVEYQYFNCSSQGYAYSKMILGNDFNVELTNYWRLKK